MVIKIKIHAAPCPLQNTQAQNWFWRWTLGVMGDITPKVLGDSTLETFPGMD